MPNETQARCSSTFCNIPLCSKVELKEGKCIFCLNKAFYPEIYPPKEKIEGN